MDWRDVLLLFTCAFLHEAVRVAPGPNELVN